MIAAAFYVAAVAALFVTAFLTWRLHCENFGCIGVGIAWFAWAVAYGVVVIFGLVLRFRSQSGAPAPKVLRSALWTQVFLGGALLLVWATKHAS